MAKSLLFYGSDVTDPSNLRFSVPRLPCVWTSGMSELQAKYEETARSYRDCIVEVVSLTHKAGVTTALCALPERILDDGGCVLVLSNITDANTVAKEVFLTVAETQTPITTTTRPIAVLMDCHVEDPQSLLERLKRDGRYLALKALLNRPGTATAFDIEDNDEGIRTPCTQRRILRQWSDILRISLIGIFIRSGLQGRVHYSLQIILELLAASSDQTVRGVKSTAWRPGLCYEGNSLDSVKSFKFEKVNATAFTKTDYTAAGCNLQDAIETNTKIADGSCDSSGIRFDFMLAKDIGNRADHVRISGYVLGFAFTFAGIFTLM